ncbi:sensor histidine kinase [Rodentibacter ratti]|uniref:histidine kinase n=1 Tax=Rodentibacter ratti TaxID=1906745 RepID=A0A1V3LCK5_9PAST|nr:sensor histidine kinase [Rodentibacter ratti]OOF87476.1 sensor histidine kinase [Rodentibacter ratti]
MTFPKVWYFFLPFLLVCTLLPNIALSKDWEIGILGQRGASHTYANWQPWIDWLNQQFTERHTFNLVVLDLDDLKQEKAKELDFIITNQLQFFYLNNNEIHWLVTLNSPRQSQQNIGSIGSAIIVRSDSPYFHLQDLRGKNIAAVGNNAFGGFLLGYHEFFQHNLKENEDLTFSFTGFPVDNTVLWLKEKKVDAAIVPVCLLEDLENEGVLKKEQFRLLLNKPNELNCWASTPLLPNWSLAAMPQVPNQLATELVTLLLTQSPAYLPQWTPPLSTNQTDNILREVYRHPQQNLWGNVKYWLLQYRVWLISIALFILLNYVWFTYQIHRKSKALEKVYQDLHYYEKQLTKADRLSILGEMSAGIAHEINQPLSAIRMYTEGLKHQLKQQQSFASFSDILDKISIQVDRSAKIMQNLMNWSKNKSDEQAELIELHSTLQRTIHFIQQQNKTANIQLNCTSDLQLIIRTVLLEQVICNCLLNALQADASHIQVNVSKESDSNFMLIDIIDNGKGFTQQQLDFPFVPFRSSKSEGLGLGLVICQRLIQSIGGEISLANNESNIGAKISLKLSIKNG